VKITSVRANNRKRVFEVVTRSGEWSFPYGKTDPSPTPADPIVELFIDPELAREGFTYVLASGAEGSVMMDHVLDYNEDPGYMRDLLLHNLTVEALKRLETTALSKREIIRRLGTSPAQFYRLLDTTNYRKSVDKMLALLQVLGCEVEVTVREKRSA
jgi:predicted XRE-type DNA-binding protein